MPKGAISDFPIIEQKGLATPGEAVGRGFRPSRVGIQDLADDEQTERMLEGLDREFHVSVMFSFSRCRRA